jgi:hypothetical protein
VLPESNQGQAPFILGLTGYARSGKDTVGGYLVSQMGFRRVAFGDTLKRVAEDMNPLIEYSLSSSSNTVSVSATETLEVLLLRHGGWEGLKDAVPETRQYLVDLGNSLRTRVGGIEIAAAFGGLQPGECVVNTNVYHGEEIDAIRAMPGGKVVRVCRFGFGPANDDEARTGQHAVDATVVNNGDVNEVHRAVAAVVRSLGWVPSPDVLASSA